MDELWNITELNKRHKLKPSYAHNCNERYSDLKKTSLYEKVYRRLLLPLTPKNETIRYYIKVISHTSQNVKNKV